MRIQSILNETNTSNASILLENEWTNLTFKQKRQITLIEKELKPIIDELTSFFLIEQEFTLDEISGIFDKAVDTANEIGNRTKIGKTKDAVSLPIKYKTSLITKINELAEKSKYSEPITDFEIKFENLKRKIVTNETNEKVITFFDNINAKAIEYKEVVNNTSEDDEIRRRNRKKYILLTSLSIGVVTAAATLLAGPFGAATAVFIIGAMSKLLEGEQLEESIFSDAVEKLKNAGKNISNIVTKDKLVNTWEKAGKPIDSEKIIKILSVYFEPSIATKIVNTYNVKELPAPDDTETNTIPKTNKLDNIVDSIKNSSESQKVIEYIKKKIQ